MLLQLIANHPEALGTIARNTPIWVWGLLTGFTALGLSQARARTASLTRVMVMPVVMTAFSLWGTVSSFGGSPLFAHGMLAWMVAASLALSIVTPITVAKGTTYDATTRTFAMPGSWVPMLLILGIFLTKYFIGVELAMQPTLAHDGQYTLVASTLYGLFSGIFIGRAARLLLLARRTAVYGTPAFNA